MDILPVNSKTLEEALLLSKEILTAIELETVSLSNYMLIASRLARLLNNFDYQQIFIYENSGYPENLDIISLNLYHLAERVDKQTLEPKMLYNDVSMPIEHMQAEIDSLNKPLFIIGYFKNFLFTIYNASIFTKGQCILTNKERIFELSNFITARKLFLHEYVTNKYYELKYFKISTDIFSRTRRIVDDNIGNLAPDAIKQFTSIYENLNSENTEDWSNAVHSCHRILQNTADAIYPVRADKIIHLPNGKSKIIKLGTENYINRLIAYIEEYSSSKTFENIVGSNISYLGERLDAIFNAVQKGSHKIITTKEEADRYVIYTYLIIGDILSLQNKSDTEQATSED